MIKIIRRVAYDVPESKKVDMLANVTDYNDINQGVLYYTNQQQGETYLDQAIRLHQSRIYTSEWLISDKFPRHGQKISDDLPPPKRVVETTYVYPFSVDKVLYDKQFLEWN